MAPGALLQETPNGPGELPSKRINNNVSKDVFPDGIRTSGQHPPIYEKLKFYDDFPKQIEGRTVWKAEDYQNNPERWVHVFTPEEKEELSKAADDFIASGLPLTGITKDSFPLPTLSKVLDEIREDVIDGKGFNLMKGFPVEEFGVNKSAVAYIGLGTYLGYFVSQNGKGHILGHVQDLGDDPTQIHRVRIYRTNARQFFHADTSDVVGLLCIHRALEGGESDIASVHDVFNVLQKERPDVVKTLTEPIWYFDRKGEVSKGQEEWIRTQILYIEPAGKGRVYSKWDPYFVRSLTRFSDAGKIPPLSPAQQEALQVLEDTCMRLALHMVLEVGDIQWLSNEHVLHSRTAYKDHAPPTPRRHLMRLWLATPESEGGWHLPFHDSDEKKRGGVQVDDTPPKYPLTGE
ncbi:Clavaminate synthase-like protein [Polychaeton citri CBS 116435]|uniref:Clavaminate synthase-like protein n=1 Tax=Polychaeton citri CBS 116435 TaxID=1314669 RepID=A0A9P4UR16_9PEZI|nr:Clavaminate synthase-like protein [Polychaeton citri CBS 116435]